jgi:hypothetical protein
VIVFVCAGLVSQQASPVNAIWESLWKSARLGLLAAGRLGLIVRLGLAWLRFWRIRKPSPSQNSMGGTMTSHRSVIVNAPFSDLIVMAAVSLNGDLRSWRAFRRRCSQSALFLHAPYQIQV